MDQSVGVARHNLVGRSNKKEHWCMIKVQHKNPECYIHQVRKKNMTNSVWQKRLSRTNQNASGLPVVLLVFKTK